MNPQPVAGVLPDFPLSIPGAKTMALMRVRSAQYAAGGGQLHSLVSNELAPGAEPTRLTPPTSFWTQNPRWLYFDVLVPFPCEVIRLVAQHNQSPRRQSRGPTYARKGRQGLVVDGLHPHATRRHDDPTKPTRMTEARIIARPPIGGWLQGRVFIGVLCFSLNANCYTGAGTSLSGREVAIVLTKAAAPPNSATMKMTVPNVVGERLDLALKALFAAKFKVTIVGPTDVSTNLQVVAEELAAGTAVEEGSGILLSTHVITPPSGVKSMTITNQSNRAAALDIWLFDYTTGQWSKETTIDYQDAGDVSFDDGHLYWIAAVDDTRRSATQALLTKRLASTRRRRGISPAMMLEPSCRGRLCEVQR